MVTSGLPVVYMLNINEWKINDEIKKLISYINLFL